MLSAIMLGVRGMLSTALGRITAAVLAGFVVWQINNAIVAKSAERKLVERSKAEGAKINATARKARAKARRDPLKHVPCRDC